MGGRRKTGGFTEGLSYRPLYGFILQCNWKGYKQENKYTNDLMDIFKRSIFGCAVENGGQLGVGAR